MKNAFVNIWLLSVTSYRWNYWLRYVILVKQISYFFWCLVPIFNRHAAVHEYNFISAALHIVYHDIFLNHIYAFLAIIGYVAVFLWIYCCEASQDDFQGVNVKLFIINKQNFLPRIWIINWNHWVIDFRLRALINYRINFAANSILKLQLCLWL
jgi:hypothetical protein